ncbi:hypothetical protein Q3W71_01430 [Micromonospora sp. C28SCA-DRY-2]|uniref:hypothetical protein n=1 Tax=Micromonospora sp. C28SCA-DRY-2 TaxID=3059522 RepID=UPI002675CC01|nr:hypothetical protein [Micromonospora sp. C28SCA-DRY-2]MDO3700341.1 hypothetical protein [Micromonospora sp. C28SCA-DRY-2]
MSWDDEREVRDLLLRAADELPAATVLPEPLLAEGRRAVRRRRLVAGAAAVVTVLALLGATALLDAARPTPPPAPPASRPPAEAPERFDPGQWLFRLDGIPDDLPLRTYSTDHRTQWVTAASLLPGEDPSKGLVRLDRVVTVKIAARGVDVFAAMRESDARAEPRRPTPAPLPGNPVDPVQGAPAYLHTSPDERETRLSWQYAPDAWAVVTVRGDEGTEGVARRFAASMVWQPYRVTLPFLDVAPPAGARLHRAVVTVYDGRWEAANLGYLAPFQPDSPQAHEDLSIGVSRDLPTSMKRGETTVAGRPAWVDGTTGGPGVYRVGQVPGTCPTCVAQVSSNSVSGRDALGGRDKALALAATVRLVDAPDDMAAWRPL